MKHLITILSVLLFTGMKSQYCTLTQDTISIHISGLVSDFYASHIDTIGEYIVVDLGSSIPCKSGENVFVIENNTNKEKKILFDLDGCNNEGYFIGVLNDWVVWQNGSTLVVTSLKKNKVISQRTFEYSEFFLAEKEVVVENDLLNEEQEQIVALHPDTIALLNKQDSIENYQAMWDDEEYWEPTTNWYKVKRVTLCVPKLKTKSEKTIWSREP